MASSSSHSFAEILNRQRSEGALAMSKHGVVSNKSQQQPRRPYAASSTHHFSQSQSQSSSHRPRSSRSSESSSLTVTATTVPSDSTRSSSVVGQPQYTQNSPIRSPEQLASFTKHPERRISDLSVVTQVRVPLPGASSDVPSKVTGRQQAPSGRTTPRSTTPVQSRDGASGSSATPRVRGALATSASVGRAVQGPNSPGRRAGFVRPMDYDTLDMPIRESSGGAPSRVMADGEDDAAAKAKAKLADMFGVRVHDLDSTTSTTHVEYSDPYDNDGEQILSIHEQRDFPAPPMRSPLRRGGGSGSERAAAPAIARASHKGGMGHTRNSSSTDTTTHNESVASSAHLTESENTAANSDVFSQDETEEAYESDISSLLGDDEASEAEGQHRQQQHSDNAGHKRRPGNILRESGARSRPRKPDNIFTDGHDRRGQRALSSAPSSAAIYDMLTDQTDAKGVASAADHASGRGTRISDRAFSPVSSAHSASSFRYETASPDLSRRPPSPALSDISDAESFDSALPPPVALTRDNTGPKYRNVAEQRRGASTPKLSRQSPSKLSSAPSPDIGSARSGGWTAAGKTSFAASADARSARSRQGTVTPSRGFSRAASRADSLPTPGFSSSTPRTLRSTSVSVDHSTTQTKTFNISLPSLSSIFGGFSLKNKKKKAPPSPLPPLRKITFDSRGQKKVVDLSILQDDFMYTNGAGEEDEDEEDDKKENEEEGNAPKGSVLDNEIRDSLTGDQEPGVDSKPSPNSQGVYDGGSQGWRSREKGAPRRTAWR